MNKMKKILLIMFAMLCSMSMSAQKPKDIKKAIDANKEIIQSLKDSVTILKRQCFQLDSITKILASRQFPRTISEEELEKELSQLTIKGIWKDERSIQSKIKLASNTNLGKTYQDIVEICNSLGVIYDEKTNKKYIKQLKTITPLDCHKDGFETLSSSIADYRFVMFEVARVLKVIDGLTGSKKEIMEKLNKSNELEFITEEDFPYAYKSVEQYINLHVNKGNKQTLFYQLKDACPDAFE